ncbi:MAG: AraC family transcriptional regulator [Patescibacteria group bacterium]|nr:AraC family transcriptional regulator [Patescibacteria group bacterium]
MKNKKTSKEIFVSQEGTEFQKMVWKELLNIKKGEVKTYTDVAKAIGKPKAVRAVASAIAKNKQLIDIPCHRVVRSDGTVGEYARGTELKIKLLESESIIIKNGKVVL